MIQFVCSQSSENEELVQTDTLAISPNHKPMIFNYYRANDAYDFKDGKRYGRFAIYYLGDNIPFQRDTIEDIWGVSYEYANFDNVLDLHITINRGASGGDFIVYYIFNKLLGAFEKNDIELGNPEVDPKDSTITESGNCCLGTGGHSKTYKYINNVLTLIAEAEYNRDYSYRKILQNDSMITINYSNSTVLSEFNGQQLIADSSWEYSFGKLRLMQVDKKRSLDDASYERLKDASVVYRDVMGAFIFDYSEHYQYSAMKDGKIKCNYLVEKNRNNKWITIKETNWVIKE